MKSKRTYKIIACVSIWLSIIIAFFGLAIAKPKAGVIIDNVYTIVSNNETNINNLEYYGALTGGNQYISMIRIFNSGNPVYDLVARPQQYDGGTVGLIRSQIQYQKYTGAPTITSPYTTCFFYEYNNNVYFMFSLARVRQDLTEVGFDLDNITIENQYNNGLFFKASATIAPCSNIYDLGQNDVALIYLSDISGLASAAYRDEITINWGYIDNSDNTLFTVHAPTVQAQRTDNNIISLAMPINAAGDATSYYTIDQSAILSTIGAGGATATAHIYGIYVWIQQSRIQWGLAEFDTSGLPASAASMNYITSLTSLYDYTAVNTSTMTCRLSISNNFNFITIKNQPILSAYNINTVIQQGGFLPAWAVYNWARGSSAGYTSGEQAGAAPYQPGNTGYQEIFEAGRQAGIAENIGTVNWFVSAFQAVDAMLNIRIFPNITIGYLVGIPFVISVVWFIIRMFRGGGSSS